jgi:FkbM family methyltransferase
VARYPVVLPEYWAKPAPVNPYCFIQALFEQLREGDITVTGNASACIVPFQAARLKPGQRLYSNSGSASMGWDLPAAIGAAAAAPGARIICLSGDGSLQMNVQELATAAYHRFPIKIFLLNNNGYHSIRQTQQAYFPESPIGFQPDNGVGFPRAEGLAQAYGLAYLRLENHAELAEGLARALALEGPALVEVMLDPAQPFAPKLASRRLEDGTMVSPALEDMAPFLSREELAENRPGLPGDDPADPCPGRFGDRVFPEAARRLEALLPGWHRERTAIALYAAGGHTRDLLAHSGFGGLNIVGIVDRNRELHGQAIGPFRVGPVEALASLRPELVLVSSTWAHDEIREELEALLAGSGIRVLDPYEGIHPYAPLFALAERHGLLLEDSLPGRLRLSQPGPRTRVFVLNARHWPYAKDVIEAFDYYFHAVRPDRETAVEQVVDIAEPGYHTLRESGVRLFFPALPEPDITTRAYLEFADLRPGDQVLDLGAYAGASSWAFAQAVGPSGRVLALEPDAENLAALRRNLADHGLAQVTAMRAAAWDRDGEALFQADGCLGSGLGEVLPRTGNRVPVPTLTLGTLVATHRIDSLRFIKMDIEGAETRVLAQALPVLRRLRPRMVIEPHLAAGVMNTGKVRQILEGGGFRTGLIEQGLGDYPLVTAWWPETM